MHYLCNSSINLKLFQNKKFIFLKSTNWIWEGMERWDRHCPQNLQPACRRGSSVQSLSRVRLFATPWTAACQASLSITTPWGYSNSCPLSQWGHATISSSLIPFSSRLHSFPASGSFQMSQLFTSGGQSIGISASASVLPMNTQDWSPLGWIGWITLQSKGL